MSTENLRGDAEVWATGQRQPGKGGPDPKGVCGWCGLACGDLGRAPREDNSFVMLVLPHAAAANLGNGVTPAGQQQRQRHSSLPKYTRLTPHFITPHTPSHF